MTAPLPRRLLVQVAPDRLRAVDLEDVYYVEAAGGDCRVRLRGREALPETRRLAEFEALLAPAGFVRIHRGVLVNPARLGELRRREGGRGWEVVMERPVNRVLPAAEELAALRERFL